MVEVGVGVGEKKNEKSFFFFLFGKGFCGGILLRVGEHSFVIRWFLI